MLSLRAMRCFVAVAENLNFTKAAASLHVAQPALTRTIRQLEDYLGAALLHRDTRNVRLTDIGQAFLEQARLALSQADHAEQIVRDMALNRIGQLTIGYTGFATYDVLAPLLRQFSLLKPSIGISLSAQPTRQQLTAIAEHTIDVAFILGPVSAPGISTHEIRAESMSVIMRKDHLLAERKTLAAPDLSSIDLVMGAESRWSVYRQIIFAEFEHCGVSPQIVSEAPTPSGILSLVAAGVGVTLFPTIFSRYLTMQYPSGQLTLRPFVMKKSQLSLVCAWSEDNDNPSVPDFLRGLPSPETRV